ncbi:MAG: hypothetical protein AAGH79_17825 [Bacteroidota bacterium]
MANQLGNFQQIITQFILIVFSVVLGLYLSERIEDQKNKKDSEKLLTTIKAEVQDNAKLMEYYLPYHAEIEVKMDSLAQVPEFVEAFIDDKYILFEAILTRGNFMARRPANDAWDIAKSHPLVVNVDYDKWVALSRIYNQQELTFQPAVDMIGLMESRDVNAPAEAAANLELMAQKMREFVSREKQLVYYYRSAQEVLDLNYEEEEVAEVDGEI